MRRSRSLILGGWSAFALGSLRYLAMIPASNGAVPRPQAETPSLCYGAECAQDGQRRRTGAGPMTIRSAVLFVLLAILVVAVAAWIGKRRQQHVLAADIDRLLRAASAHAVTAPADSQVRERLPSPVARYLRLALPSPRHIQEMRMRQTGTLRTDATSERWMPFDAEHIVVPPATGFVWDARVRI